MRSKPRRVAIGVLVVWGSLMQPTASEAELAGLEIRRVEHLPEYVIGFPAYAAITVQARPGVRFNSLRFADITGLHESIGLEMIGADGTPIGYMPKPIIDETLGAEPESLEPGETRRMLTDVSPLFGPSPAEGSYTMRFAYVSPEAVFRAEPVSIKLRKPTEAEQALRASAAPDRASFATWASWSVTCPERPVPPHGELKPENPLAFSLLLRHLFCGPEPLEQLKPMLLNPFTGLYAPERDALRAEYLKIRGDEAAYQRLRASTLQTTPGLAWWFRMIDENGAYLKTFSLRPR